ncbi:hypothetical protein Poli38472_000640 [Pythium oligandrum]|uniref:Uncharacterized protein n=1 Tax=Pythium oligandrum TaxID=41045 RepID=A0A8K1FJB8_PYTOL|nr:hypothetical protein Poli38472_000640 [Pythium oligandrum]|eukprot:TMW60598.1 hypothetical protein Poli38472_000640 [Pythium oligandrum]
MVVATTRATPSHEATEQPQVPHNQRIKSLLHLATLSVAEHCPIDVIAETFEWLPVSVRPRLLAHLTNERLRRLEQAVLRAESDGESAKRTRFDAAAAHDEEFQTEWTMRCERLGLRVDTLVASETLFKDPRAPRNARKVFWEHEFRSYLRAPSGGRVRPDGEWEPERRPDLTLFEDVVETLKVNARELVPRNVAWMLRLPRFRRLELHHPTEQQQANGWLMCLVSFLTQASTLEELGFFHGRVTRTVLEDLMQVLLKRESGVTPIRKLELVSVKLKEASTHRQLVTLFTRCTQLERVRISSTIADFDNRCLVDTFFHSSQLVQLSIEHNDLEDDAFLDFLRERFTNTSSHGVGQAATIRHLRLGNNALSVLTIQALCGATLDGFLALERLELRNNMEIGDAGVHALAPMLSTASTLTHLDLRNCHFGLEGALTLLTALGSNQTLRSLDLSQNFFGSSFGDLLGDFLWTNTTLERLHINYVGLGHSGCTDALLRALQANTSLVVLSVGANRLRDHGATVLFRAIVRRSQQKPFEAVDLGGNLLTVEAMEACGKVLEDARREEAEKDGIHGNKRSRVKGTYTIQSDEDEENQPRLIQELSVLNNDLASDRDRATRALDQLRRYVKQLHSNEWSSRRNVYDDEV